MKERNHILLIHYLCHHKDVVLWPCNDKDANKQWKMPNIGQEWGWRNWTHHNHQGYWLFWLVKLMDIVAFLINEKINCFQKWKISRILCQYLLLKERYELSRLMLLHVNIFPILKLKILWSVKECAWIWHPLWRMFQFLPEKIEKKRDF